MAENSTIVVNDTIVNSIPLNKDLKRYFIKWFREMCRSNGNRFAVDKVKTLRELLMSYRSDPHRLKNLDGYLSKAPIRKNKRLRQLFTYMDTNPLDVLNFLKFYLGNAASQQTVEQSQDDFHGVLLSITSQVKQPQFLTNWLELLTGDLTFKRSQYLLARNNTKHPYHYAAKHHSMKQWVRYWTTWYRRLILKASSQESRDYSLQTVASSFVPTSSMYSDFDGSHDRSDQFDRDAESFLGFFPDSRGGVESVPLEHLDWLLVNAESDRVFNMFDLDEIVGDLPADEWYVGEVHHIPKTGTTDLRPIAVPNRFLQYGLKPYQKFLFEIIKDLPRDHTFSQGKSSTYVQNRIDNGFYVESVDLSKATEYLPLSVLEGLGKILDELVSKNDDIIASKRLFEFMARAPWKNGNHLDRWLVGQPLGTLPSFGVLALSHNILLESLALSGGYLHSPYVVLGDDVLLFSKRLGRLYRAALAELHVPISEHKSYSHELVEFAGRTHIRNQGHSYTPNPYRVTWYNLFDYSRNSGILVKFDELPRPIRHRLAKQATKVALDGSTFYRLAAEYYFAAFGSRYRSYMDLTMETLESLFATLGKDKQDVPAETTSGWTVFTFTGEDRLAYTGRSVLRTDRSAWLKDKFKPATTNAIIANAILALQHHRNQFNGDEGLEAPLTG